MATKLKELLARMSNKELLERWEELDSRDVNSPLVNEYFDLFESNTITIINEGISFNTFYCAETTYSGLDTASYPKAA